MLVCVGCSAEAGQMGGPNAGPAVTFSSGSLCSRPLAHVSLAPCQGSPSFVAVGMKMQTQSRPCQEWGWMPLWRGKYLVGLSALEKRTQLHPISHPAGRSEARDVATTPRLMPPI